MNHPDRPPVVFAILGDVHGAIDRAVELLAKAESSAGLSLSFVIQVGDLEAHCEDEDLQGMYAPFRAKSTGDFPHYWAGRKRFPWPLYFIGGNHEPYERLAALPAKSELVENVHYLGRAGQIEFQGIQVAYLSGVYDEPYYQRPASERGGVSGDRDWEMQRFLRCFVEEEVRALYAQPRPRVLLIHEWPLGLVRVEDHEQGEPSHRKLRFGETGVRVLAQLVQDLAPEHVFCGHLHRSYQGTLYGSQIHCLGQVGGRDSAIQLMLYDGLRLEQLAC